METLSETVLGHMSNGFFQDEAYLETHMGKSGFRLNKRPEGFLGKIVINSSVF